jgi:hypothetical protein
LAGLIEAAKKMPSLMEEEDEEESKKMFELEKEEYIKIDQNIA